jgi:Tfp pilus assembly protein PilV
VSAASKRGSSRGAAGGFTLIEIMISLLIFMVALLGLIALQKVSIASANIGREHTGAVNVARYAMTRLQNEAATWPLADDAISAADFPMLAQALGDAAGTWQLLPAANESLRLDAYLEHSARDFYTSGVDSAPYCVNYMIQPVGPEARPDDLLRVRVRVVWPKWGQYVLDEGNWDDCDPGVVGSRLPYSEVVELSGVLTREFTGRMVQ